MGDLIRFVQHVDSDSELQVLIVAAPDPAAIVSVAADRGFAFAVQELRQVSRDLNAAYWPWAGKGNGFRRRWFTQVL